MSVVEIAWRRRSRYSAPVVGLGERLNVLCDLRLERPCVPPGQRRHEEVAGDRRSQCAMREPVVRARSDRGHRRARRCSADEISFERRNPADIRVFRYSCQLVRSSTSSIAPVSVVELLVAVRLGEGAVAVDARRLGGARARTGADLVESRPEPPRAEVGRLPA